MIILPSGIGHHSVNVSNFPFKADDSGEVTFVKETRVTRCHCRVAGKAVCEKDLTSFEGCEDGEECRAHKVHASDLLSAGIQWCRTFLITGISAGRKVVNDDDIFYRAEHHFRAGLPWLD